MQVIPAVNATTFEEAKRQFLFYRSFLPVGVWMQVDVNDGIFSPKKLWGNPEELALLKDELRDYHLEIHLMVVHPERVVEEWLRAGARRIIVHLESKSDPDFIRMKCEDHGAETMLAVNPNTSALELLAYADHFSYFQILAVSPGPSGQPFDARMVEKIRALRANIPSATIEVDGGITPKTASLVREAGADIMVSASYLLDAADPKRAYEELLRA